MTTNNVKVCKKCGENKSLSNFYEEKNYRDGHRNVCKDCNKKRRDELLCKRRNITEKVDERVGIRPKTIKIIERANEFISANGGSMTIRAIHYKFVANGLRPNTLKSYKRLSCIMTIGREAGLIGWNDINDISRRTNSFAHFQNPAHLFEHAADIYCLDTRHDQEYYLECWVEKDAMLNSIESVCDDLDMLYFSCRGYSGLSSLYEAAGRFTNESADGKNNIILYLGDHDPSGLDMVNSMENRMEYFGVDVEFKRLALTKEQVKLYGLPPNWAKVTDMRWKSYIAEHGKESWEVDALDRQVVEDLIRAAENEYTNQNKRNALIELEQIHKAEIADFIERNE